MLNLNIRKKHHAFLIMNWKLSIWLPPKIAYFIYAYYIFMSPFYVKLYAMSPPPPATRKRKISQKCRREKAPFFTFLKSFTFSIFNIFFYIFIFSIFFIFSNFSWLNNHIQKIKIVKTHNYSKNWYCTEPKTPLL